MKSYHVIHADPSMPHTWTAVFRKQGSRTDLVALRFDAHPGVSPEALSRLIHYKMISGTKSVDGKWCNCLEISAALRGRHLGRALVTMMSGSNKTVSDEMTKWFEAATARQTQRLAKRSL